MQQMADKLGISVGGYCMKEHGQRNLTAEEFVKICKLAGVKAEDVELPQ